MDKLTIDSLPDDAFVNVQVFLDEKFILFSPDIPVSSEAKNRLRKWGFSNLTSSGPAAVVENIGTMAVPQNQEMLEQSLEEQRLQKEATNYYHNCLGFLNKIFDEFQLKGTIRFSETSEKVKDIRAQVKANKRFFLSLSDEAVEGVSYNVSHSVKTAFLAMIITDNLKLALHRQIEVGVAALLHRLGMLKLPPELYMANRRLSPQERQILITYPVLSFRILKTANFPMSVALGVLEHQEKMDGSGYPRKLSGDKISVYGRIISVASSYTAAVAERPYKTGLDGHTGIMDMIKYAGGTYDQNILKALILTVSVFPIGTYVELTDKSRGVVVSTDPDHPRSPTVKLLLDGTGKPHPEQPLFQPVEGDPLQIKRPLTKTEQGSIEKLYKDT